MKCRAFGAMYFKKNAPPTKFSPGIHSESLAPEVQKPIDGSDTESSSDASGERSPVSYDGLQQWEASESTDMSDSDSSSDDYGSLPQWEPKESSTDMSDSDLSSDEMPEPGPEPSAPTGMPDFEISSDSYDGLPQWEPTESSTDMSDSELSSGDMPEPSPEPVSDTETLSVGDYGPMVNAGDSDTTISSYSTWDPRSKALKAWKLWTVHSTAQAPRSPQY